MIKVNKLSKKYKVYSKRVDRLKEWLSFGQKQWHQDFWALHNISLDIPTGQVFGIIGMNGAGKSTLLKIITGTTKPTFGDFCIKGRISAILELGTGFHPELSGRENVIVNGKLHGLSEQEIKDRIEEIKQFSELGDFFEQTVRTYSSGMYVRLAFALASSIDPDVFIIDEALSVGDAYFQQKCLTRIHEFKRQGKTILFVSHDMQAINLLCDQVALLDRGRLVAAGGTQELLELYNALLAKHDGHGREYVIEQEHAINGVRVATNYGNRKAVIRKVEIQNVQNQPVQAVVVGESCRIVVDVEFQETIENPTVGILIKDRLGYEIFGTNTAELHQDTGFCQNGTTKRFAFLCALNLGAGSYTVTAAVHTSVTHVGECFNWADRVLTFKVLPKPDYHFLGVTYIEPSLSVESI